MAVNDAAELLLGTPDLTREQRAAVTTLRAAATRSGADPPGPFGALGGVAPQRPAPRFAERTFTSWFADHEPRHPDGAPVLLWPDTFTTYFEPDVGIATTEVLESAGFRVLLPERPLCCGRPFYDYGMLTLARRHLRRILDVIAPQIRAGVPVVGMEPSCLAVFRDELLGLFPDDVDAQRLHAQSVLLSEFLTRQAHDWPLPQLHRSALVQPHCHHHAVCGFDDEAHLLEQMGLDVQQPDAGCCGMAGSFGYEAGDRYEVSVAAGERLLLPAVRAAGGDTVLIADGFSCRSQIAQLTDRRALHLAQVLRMAVKDGADGPAGRRPEERPEPAAPDGARSARIPAVSGGAVLAAALTAAIGRRRSHHWRRTR